MSKPSVTVEQYMTAGPHTIGVQQTLAAAHDLMRSHNVRHLPVLNGGQVVGMLSIRDLHLVETLPDVDPAKVKVEDAMSGNPYTVPPSTNLRDVVATMAEHKYGSAVVVDGAKIVGVFTTTDALRALSDCLE